MAITFSDPMYLWLLLIIPLFIITHFYSLKYVKKRAIRFANFEALSRISGGVKISINWIILLLRFLIIALLIFSAAGMVYWYSGLRSDNNFILAIDASGSMLANDLKPNRLEAAKNAALFFVDNLHSDAEVGVVSFSGIGEIEHHLSASRYEIKEAIRQINFKSIHGTAIGDVVKISMNMLSENEKPRVVILLTDGRENIAAEEEVVKVIELAKKNEITIHTIGIGTEEGGELPQLDMVSTLDEEFLTKISTMTGGRYFHADTNDRLKEAYELIATSTTSNVPIKLRIPLILIVIFLIFIEWGIINTKYKSIP